MKYTSVLIEIEDAQIGFKNPVIVLKDFDNTKPLGHANLYQKEGKLFADMEVFDDVKGLFPAIGFSRATDKIYTIGLCETRNVDERIAPIG